MAGQRVRDGDADPAAAIVLHFAPIHIARLAISRQSSGIVSGQSRENDGGHSADHARGSVAAAGKQQVEFSSNVQKIG